MNLNLQHQDYLQQLKEKKLHLEGEDECESPTSGLPAAIEEIQKKIQLENEDACGSQTSGFPAAVKEIQRQIQLENGDGYESPMFRSSLSWMSWIEETQHMYATHCCYCLDFQREQCHHICVVMRSKPCNKLQPFQSSLKLIIVGSSCRSTTCGNRKPFVCVSFIL